MSKENMVRGSEHYLHGYSMKIHYWLHPRATAIHKHLFTTFAIGFDKSRLVSTQ